MTHAIQRRWFAEQLVRLRRADERRRYTASQRRGHIDPNPHQIHAVIFALGRVREGGCILADEVGLGKTIEAGLVIVQLMAEGARRVLIIVPKTLQGQWQQELYTLFGIDVRHVSRKHGSLETEEALVGGGVFLVGREWAGGEKGSAALQGAEPFDLCVIDEAHEIFAGLYKRYDRFGVYQPASKHAQMAGRVKELLTGTPVLLLTATPIQNSLAELWGLVQYVEPTGTLLGDVRTFRQVFCDGDDRKLVAGQDQELRQRIATVCRRTLRRQAQEFMEKPFVDRRARLFEYTMAPEEKALYDDLTQFLMDPLLVAFRGNHRRLLILVFHRQMASSVKALAASLRNVAKRLRKMLELTPIEALAADAEATVGDLEEDLEATEVDDGAPPASNRVQAELARVEELIERADALPRDSKADAMIKAVKLVFARAERGEGKGKIVIFTESLTTQEYIRELLMSRSPGGGGLADADVTLFRGQNSGPRVRAAVERWKQDVGNAIPAYNRPSRAVAVRMALVHEFRTRSRIFVSTEAGAKGLNLQFCDTLMNYDLPWNPQRIEQRIGRCHRYSQTHDVTVINFLASDNEAQRLTFEILSQKLDLFGTVLAASDDVLHEPRTRTPETIVNAMSVDFETRLERIYERSRSYDRLLDELRELRETIGSKRDRYEKELARTKNLIESQFDEAVSRKFRQIQQELSATLAELDRDADRVLRAYLEAVDIPFERTEHEGLVRFDIAPCPRLPAGLTDGLTVTVGESRGASGAESGETAPGGRDLGETGLGETGLSETGLSETLYLGHPLLEAAVAEAREATRRQAVSRQAAYRHTPYQPFRVELRPAADQRTEELDQALAARRGQRGRLVGLKVRYQGFEPVERLIPVAVMETSGEILPLEAASALLTLEPTDIEVVPETLELDDEDVEDAIEEALFIDQHAVAAGEQQRFDRSIAQLERSVDDRVLVLRRQLRGVEKTLKAALRKRDTVMGADARTAVEKDVRGLQSQVDTLEAEIRRLQARDDPDYEKWHRQAHRRRYAEPMVERILDVDFVLV